MVTSDVGEPEELLPNDDHEEGIPTWSRDGRQIVYGEVPIQVGLGTGKEVIHLCDLSTRQVSVLPGSQGLWTSRWSPDGRYIAAVTVDRSQRLKLYDTQTRSWQDLGPDHVENPLWSHDGKYVYFGRESNKTEGVFRIRVSDGTYERVAQFGNLRLVDDGWNGLTEDDLPLVLRDAGIQEIYALDVNWP